MKAFIVVIGVLLLSALSFGQDDPESPTTGDAKIDTGDENVKGNVSDASPDTPNTTPVDASTTTPAPSPSNPTEPPAPAPTGDPDKEPKEGKYKYTDEKNVTCIMLNAAIQFSFTYEKKEGNKTKTETIIYDLPVDNANVSGKCAAGNETSEVLNITFNGDWVLSFMFKETKDKYSIKKISLDYTMSDHWFPNMTANETHMTSTTTEEVKQFEVDSDKSMQCKSKVTIQHFSGNLTDMYTWNVHFEAFRTKKNDDFADSMYCDADTKVSNLVPIIVGAALAGLVLIVLIAYLIGRTRNKRGYESV